MIEKIFAAIVTIAFIAWFWSAGAAQEHQGPALAPPPPAIQLSSDGCNSYALDAAQFGLARKAGISKAFVEQWVKAQEPLYKNNSLAHALELLDRMYASVFDPIEESESIYHQCINDGGWIGKGRI
ncbi:MAG: hypothetical protein ACREUQ_00780 [Burkholderiales bacterium]